MVCVSDNLPVLNWAVVYVMISDHCNSCIGDNILVTTSLAAPVSTIMFYLILSHPVVDKEEIKCRNYSSNIYVLGWFSYNETRLY